jgi:hypothetical protein
MTKKIYYIFTLIGSLLLSSCDSYLDIQPVGQVIPNTLAEYRALFTTAYNTALNDRGICEIRTDIATILQSDATSKNSLGDVENGMMLIRMQVRDNLDGRPIIPISIMPTQSSIKKMKYQKEAKKILIN